MKLQVYLIYIDGYNILADSAFTYTKDMEGKVFAVLKDTVKEKLADKLSREEFQARMQLDRAIIGQRQAAEWGMGAFQRTFARLKVPLPCDDKKRLILLKSMGLLYNFRCEKVGFNQIRSVFAYDNEKSS